MPGTDGTPDHDGRSHRQTDDHDGQHVHDLTAVCDSGRTFGSVELSDDEQALEKIVLADERKRFVNIALSKLPDDMRAVIHLIYFEDMTYDEAAKITKKNRKQVDNLLYRAKKELRTLLGEEGERL